MLRNRSANLVSVITQPWRRLGAILWIPIIIHIFKTLPHKLPKFTTHKLQTIWQKRDNPRSRARQDTHVRARQNLKLLKIKI